MKYFDGIDFRISGESPEYTTLSRNRVFEGYYGIQYNHSGRLLFSVDGSPDTKSALLDPDSPMTGIGAQSPITMGKTAAKTAVAILNRDRYEKEIYAETFFINRENVDMYGTDGWQ